MKRTHDQVESDTEGDTASQSRTSVREDTVTALAPPKLQEKVRTLLRTIPAHSVQEIINGLGVNKDDVERTAVSLSRPEWMARRSHATQIAAFMANEFITDDEMATVRHLYKHSKGAANIQQCWMALVCEQDDLEKAEKYLDFMVERKIGADTRR